ncbi:hypothetical protein LSAT2_030618 [Lamellibrachia satsuma]|nr:hypothetical protein LSAT2_030618 [Lamellibrachia satsuma]
MLRCLPVCLSVCPFFIVVAGMWGEEFRRSCDRRAAFSRPIERQIFKTWTQEFFILRFIILHWQTTGLSSFSSSILNSRTRSLNMRVQEFADSKFLEQPLVKWKLLSSRTMPQIIVSKGLDAKRQ